MARPTLLDQPPAGQASADPAAAGGSRAGAAGDVEPGRAARAHWWRRRRYWVAAGAVVAVVLLAATNLAVSLHALSKPTLSAGAVNATVNAKVGAAINSLQTQPPAGEVVYKQVAPPWS